jgi:hypothetical protein
MLRSFSSAFDGFLRHAVGSFLVRKAVPARIALSLIQDADGSRRCSSTILKEQQLMHEVEVR